LSIHGLSILSYESNLTSSPSCFLALVYLLMLRRPQRCTFFPYTTLFRSLGRNIGGNQNWLYFGSSLFMIQPSEFAKLAMVVWGRSEEHTSELQSRENLVCRLLLEKKKKSKEMRVNKEPIGRPRSWYDD